MEGTQPMTPLPPQWRGHMESFSEKQNPESTFEEDWYLGRNWNAQEMLHQEHITEDAVLFANLWIGEMDSDEGTKTKEGPRLHPESLISRSVLWIQNPLVCATSLMGYVGDVQLFQSCNIFSRIGELLCPVKIISRGQPLP